MRTLLTTFKAAVLVAHNGEILEERWSGGLSAEEREAATDRGVSQP